MSVADVRRRAARTAEPGRDRGRAGAVAVVVWAAGIAAAFAAGWYLRRAGLATEDELPPLHARARAWPLTWQLLPAAGVAAAGVAVLPAVAARLRWRWVPLVAWAASALWAVALAAADGPGALAAPLDAPTEYPAGLAALRPDPAEWLRTFTERLGGYPTHTRGHPPLPMLALWLLERVGLGGTGWAAAFVIGAGASAAAAIAVTLRRVAGERAARVAVPFLVLAPVALWIATAMDAVFLAVGAWGTALLAMAARRPPPDGPSDGPDAADLVAGGPAGRPGERGGPWPAALGAGLLLGCLPYLSYGLLPLLAVPLAVVLLCRPRAGVLAALGAGLVVVPVAFTLAGFWWPDGVRATLDTYLISRGSARRSYSYFLFADVAVLGLLTGPAVARALPATLAAAWRGARRGAWRAASPASPAFAVALPACAALLGMLALDVAGVTKGEVERIWVPFAAWLPAVAPLARPASRWWLAAQAVTALAVQALVLSEW